MKLGSPVRWLESSGSAAAPAPVLLVDDNAGKRVALKAVLAPLGLRVVEADSGTAALRCLLAENFAVILLDVRMPVMGGFETAALIRQRPQSEMTPIIFITAYSADEIVTEDRYSGGAVDFMSSPVAPQELRAKVSVFANLFVRAEHLAAQARAVRASADQLTLLTDAAPIGIFQTDVENRYVYTNPRWTEITGIWPEEAAGKVWDTIMDPDQRAELRAELADGGVYRAVLCHRFEMRFPGALPRMVMVTAKPIPGDAETAGWVGTLADVTAEAAAQIAMSDARDTALSATLMQKNFATSASHELRTPTTSIIGFVEAVLDNQALSEQDRRFLEIVRRNAERLNMLIDDLLILGEADIGESVMHVEATELVPLVGRVTSNFSSSAHDAGIALVTDHEANPLYALVDPLRVEQALTNLISNALKFTPSGGEVKTGIHGRGDTVEITVSDTGPGIDAVDLERIFGRFFRAKGALDSGVKGTGLGLAIAKKMIEAQGGHLSVTSTLGAGSTFTISLPVATRSLQPV